jgi:hypothetical protein
MIQLDPSSIKEQVIIEYNEHKSYKHEYYQLNEVNSKLNEIIKQIYPLRKVDFPTVLLSIPGQFGLESSLVQVYDGTIIKEDFMLFVEWFNSTLTILQNPDMVPLWKTGALYGWPSIYRVSSGQYEVDQHVESEHVWFMYFDPLHLNSITLRNKLVHHTIIFDRDSYLIKDTARHYATIYDLILDLNIPEHHVFYHRSEELSIHSNIMLLNMHTKKIAKNDIIFYQLDKHLKKKCRIASHYFKQYNVYQPSIPFLCSNKQIRVQSALGLYITDLDSENRIVKHTLPESTYYTRPYFTLYYQGYIYMFYEPMPSSFVTLKTLLPQLHKDRHWVVKKWLIVTNLMNTLCDVHSKSIYHRYINFFSTFINPRTLQIKFGHMVNYCSHELSCEIIPMLQNYELLDYNLDLLHELRNGIDVAIASDWYSIGWLTMYVLFGEYEFVVPGSLNKFNLAQFNDIRFDETYLSFIQTKDTGLFYRTFQEINDYFEKKDKISSCDTLSKRIYDYCWRLLLSHCFSTHFDIKLRRITESSILLWNTIISSIDFETCLIKNESEIEHNISLVLYKEVMCPHSNQKTVVPREITLLITGHGNDVSHSEKLQELKNVFIASPVRHGCFNMAGTAYELAKISALYNAHTELPSCVLINYFLDYNKNQVEYDYLSQLYKHTIQYEKLIEQSDTIKRMISRKAYSKVIQPIIERTFSFNEDGEENIYNGIFVLQFKHPSYDFPKTTTIYPPNLINVNDMEKIKDIPFLSKFFCPYTRSSRCYCVEPKHPINKISLSTLLDSIQYDFDQINIIDLTCRSIQHGLPRLNSSDVTIQEDIPRQGRAVRKSKGRKKSERKTVQSITQALFHKKT